ncbi:unnamed protein product [Lepeophtheirus salmonis]|uniref:(salmon louse) hypothetical protein n=1 Tax=Lepeophtheirus salmonis TaxID=72036 RepID=A0A7R8H502_LEPSM|nr:unnamed protein product [Lepeophtheirus salmonis]CAF2868398.1 unnamed protein product [Lepeophtheirus salmonis]
MFFEPGDDFGSPLQSGLLGALSEELLVSSVVNTFSCNMSDSPQWTCSNCPRIPPTSSDYGYYFLTNLSIFSSFIKIGQDPLHCHLAYPSIIFFLLTGTREKYKSFAFWPPPSDFQKKKKMV